MNSSVPHEFDSARFILRTRLSRPKDLNPRVAAIFVRHGFGKARSFRRARLQPCYKKSGITGVLTPEAKNTLK
jgi:hypothetical protein